jgi:aryl-alcohol dehydrogenase-like predicted oxidoreductase
MEVKNKLGLGTVQFGLEYGINNSSGMVSYNEVVKIIDCYHNEVKDPIYDTALGYGTSHIALGNAFYDLKITNPKIISKFSDDDLAEVGLTQSLSKSLKELKQEKLYGFIAHSADTLIDNEKAFDELKNLKDKGLTKKIGVSAYFPAQINYFIDKNLPIDLIQVPYNIFDQRFDDVLKKCKAKGIEVHTRSAFLQGLIFKDISFFKDYFAPFKLSMEAFKTVANETKENLNSMALSFACANPNIDKVLMGVDSKENLIENFKNIHASSLSKLMNHSTIFKQEDENVLLPFNWPKS